MRRVPAKQENVIAPPFIRASLVPQPSGPVLSFRFLPTKWMRGYVTYIFTFHMICTFNNVPNILYAKRYFAIFEGNLWVWAFLNRLLLLTNYTLVFVNIRKSGIKIW